MPGGRRTGMLLVAMLLIVAGGGAAWLMAAGKAPALKRASQTLAASVAQLAASYASSSPEDEAGVPPAEASAPVHRQTGPLSSAQLGAPLVHGAFVSACGAGDDMKVTLKVSVKNGHAVNVAVKTDPGDPTVASCIEHATREMQWDISPKTDHVTVTY